MNGVSAVTGECDLVDDCPRNVFVKHVYFRSRHGTKVTRVQHGSVHGDVGVRKLADCSNVVS